MAYIDFDKIERRNTSINKIHDSVKTEYITGTVNGIDLFQIDTYGKDGRATPSKVSQSIQFSKEGARKLILLLNKELKLEQSDRLKNLYEDSGKILTKNTVFFSSFLPHPHNRIIFGAPGTGKSHLLEQERSQHFDEAHYERVTFHPNYTYSQFVGAYKPVALENEGIAVLDSNTKYILSILQDKNKTAQEKYDSLYKEFNSNENLTRLPLLIALYTDGTFKTKTKDGQQTSDDNMPNQNHGKAIRPFVKLYSEKSSTNDITYAFVPGPFIHVLAKAMQNPSENFLLVIEEINRANVAAVFGDVFQLLDRDESGKSEYPIDAGEDLKNYLEGQGISLSDGKIAIPANMYIWATMNSADQGVMPLDAAFKRRWEFEYIGIDENESEVASYEIPNMKNSDGDSTDFTFINWNYFRKALNKKLKNLQGTIVNEDKLLGPFFLDKHCLEMAKKKPEDFVRLFKSKVLMYLYEDVCKMNPRALFTGIADGGRLHYSDVCATFDKMGVRIFGDDFVKASSGESNG